MNTHAQKAQEDKNKSVTDGLSQKRSAGRTAFQFADNRAEAIVQRKLQAMADNSPQAKRLAAFRIMTDKSPRAGQITQLSAMANNHTDSQSQSIKKSENKMSLLDAPKARIEYLSGIPDQLKAGLELPGGFDLSGVSPGKGTQRKQPGGVFHQASNRSGVIQRAITVEGTTYPYGVDSGARSLSLREFRRTLMIKLKQHDFKELGSRAMWNFVNNQLTDEQNKNVGTWSEFLEKMWDAGLLQRIQRGTSFGPKNLGSRPTWFPETTDDMPVGSGEHRRHIISSSSLGRGIEKAYEQLKVNVTDSNNRLEQLNQWLARHNGEKQTSEYSALRLIWQIVHNHQGNLWVGPGNWNSAIGFIRSPLAGVLEKLQGTGTVNLNELLEEIKGIKPGLKSLESQWVEIRDTLRATLAHAEPHISETAFGAAFIKWNEEVQTMEGSDCDEGMEVYRALEKKLVFPDGYERLSTVAKALKELMASRIFHGNRALQPIYLKWLEAFSYAPTSIRKNTARELIQDWISNADLDYPYELIEGGKPEYFLALNEIYTKIMAPDASLFNLNGALDRFMNLDFKSSFSKK